jgi:O-antigen/teichoic acid export membrane protein
MDRRHQILAQMSYAAAARYISQGLRIVRGIGLAHFLGPAGFGLWNAMRIVLQFCGYAELGARSGMLQHATYAEATRQTDHANRLRGTAATVNLVGAIAVAAGIAFVISIPGLAIGDRWLWVALAGLVVTQNMWMYLQSSLRSQRRYGLCSSLSILMATLSTGLGVLGAYWYGIAGFLAALILCYLLAYTTSFWFAGQFPRLVVDRDQASRLIRTGFPIMVGDLLKVLMWNVDKILVWILMGKHALGIYALQSTITNAIMLLPAGISEVLYPHVVAGIGRSKSIDTSRRYLTDGADLLSRAMCPILAVAFLVLPLPIRWLLPAYHETVAPGQVLVLATFFPIAGTVAGSVLVALGGQRVLLAASAAGVIVAGIGAGLAIQSGGGYVAIALGAAAGLLTRAGISTAAAMTRAGLETPARIGFLARLASRFALLVLVVAGAAWAVPAAPDSLLLDCLLTTLRCTLALAVFAPGMLKAWRTQRRNGWLAAARPVGDETTSHA